MYEAMTGFGLGHATGIDLPLEKDGLYPSREWKRKNRHENWYPGETLNAGIGQGYVLATPLQLAQMTARIEMRGGESGRASVAGKSVSVRGDLCGRRIVKKKNKKM